MAPKKQKADDAVAPVVGGEPEPVELTAEEQARADAEAAVAAASAEVAEAQKALDEAAAAHKEAVAAQAAAQAALEPTPTYGKHIFVDFGGGVPTLRDAPKGYNADAPDYRLLVDGKNVEHVGEVACKGGYIWVYRAM